MVCPLAAWRTIFNKEERARWDFLTNYFDKLCLVLIQYNISCDIYSICTKGGDWVKARLNGVDINPVLRKGNLGEISLQEKQETQEEKTFPETFLAVVDRVFSRQGISRSILIQAVLVRILCISKYSILIQADKLGIFENTYFFSKLRVEDCSCRRLGSPRSG